MIDWDRIVWLSDAEDVQHVVLGDPDSPNEFDGLDALINMPKWKWLLINVRSRIEYCTGFTHQFSCKECGAPIEERTCKGSASVMWEWHCSYCGWQGGCGHAPRIMKWQHRFVLRIRELIFLVRSKVYDIWLEK